MKYLTIISGLILATSMSVRSYPLFSGSDGDEDVSVLVNQRFLGRGLELKTTSDVRESANSRIASSIAEVSQIGNMGSSQSSSRLGSRSGLLTGSHTISNPGGSEVKVDSTSARLAASSNRQNTANQKQVEQRIVSPVMSGSLGSSPNRGPQNPQASKPRTQRPKEETVRTVTLGSLPSSRGSNSGTEFGTRLGSTLRTGSAVGIKHGNGNKLSGISSSFSTGTGVASASSGAKLGTGSIALGAQGQQSGLRTKITTSSKTQESIFGLEDD